MTDSRWNSAGWLALVSAALIPPNFVLTIISDIAIKRGTFGVPFAMLASLTGALSFIFGLIVLFRFRQLLNERFQYHGVDGLITATIVLVSLLALFSITGRPMLFLLGLADKPVLALLFIAPVMVLGALAGVIGIIIGAKLFSLDTDLGLMRPYAILSIVSGTCFALVLLAPLGLLVSLAESILLALMFFRASQHPAPTPEFV